MHCTLDCLDSRLSSLFFHPHHPALPTLLSPPPPAASRHVFWHLHLQYPLSHNVALLTLLVPSVGLTHLTNYTPSFPELEPRSITTAIHRVQASVGCQSHNSTYLRSSRLAGSTWTLLRCHRTPYLPLPRSARLPARLIFIRLRIFTSSIYHITPVVSTFVFIDRTIFLHQHSPETFISAISESSLRLKPSHIQPPPHSHKSYADLDHTPT